MSKEKDEVWVGSVRVSEGVLFDSTEVFTSRLGVPIQTGDRWIKVEGRLYRYIDKEFMEFEVDGM